MAARSRSIKIPTVFLYESGMGIPCRKNRKTEIYKLHNSVSCRTVIYFHYYRTNRSLLPVIRWRYTYRIRFYTSGHLQKYISAYIITNILKMAWMGRSCRVFSKRTAPWLEERQKENSKSPRSRQGGLSAAHVTRWWVAWRLFRWYRGSLFRPMGWKSFLFTGSGWNGWDERFREVWTRCDWREMV